MFRLDKDKFNQLLVVKGWSLAKLAKQCGISRQSIYSMFDGESIFSRPFEKMMKELRVDLRELLIEANKLNEILAEAPDAVTKAALELQQYAENHKANLYLIGSRARGRSGIRADWDFGIYFAKGRPADFAGTKQRIQDRSFPHRLDIVDLSNAPSWFLNSVADDALHMTGTTKRDRIFGGSDDRRVA